MADGMRSSFTERLATASREELLEHVLLQRELIQRLHERVLDLESCLQAQTDEDETDAACVPSPPPPPPPHSRVVFAQPSARDYNPPQQRRADSTQPPAQRDASPLTEAEDRLEEIRVVLAAHAAGKPRLPPAMVRQLLLIREDLQRERTSQRAARPSSEEQASGRLVEPQWVRTESLPPAASPPAAPFSSPPTRDAWSGAEDTHARGSRRVHSGVQDEEPYFDAHAPPHLARQFLSAWGTTSQ